MIQIPYLQYPMIMKQWMQLIVFKLCFTHTLSQNTWDCFPNVIVPTTYEDSTLNLEQGLYAINVVNGPRWFRVEVFVYSETEPEPEQKLPYPNNSNHPIEFIIYWEQVELDSSTIVDWKIEPWPLSRSRQC